MGEMTGIGDFRYGLRAFGRSPGFTIAAVLSIGIGIAANTTVFSIVNAASFGNLPVREPKQLVSLTNLQRSGTMPYGDFVDYRDGAGKVFEGVTAYFPVVAASLSTPGAEPERIWGQIVAGNYFDVVQSPMTLGRGFAAAEDVYGNPQQVVVLGHGLWKSRFGGDPAIAGKNITLNNRKFTVVGVTGEGFRGLDRGLMSDFWVPLALMGQVLPGMEFEKLREQRNAQWLMVAARLRPGVSRQEATAAIQALHTRADQQYRKDRKPSQMGLEDAGGLPGGSTRFVRPIMFAVMGVVSLVLLIACANVANLMLARGAARQREIGVRMAVGASRFRIVQQWLAESLLLALGGGVVGFVLASFAARAVQTLQLPLPVPLAINFSADWRVVAYTLVLAFLAAFLFGLLPAIRATQIDVGKVIKDESVASGGFRKFGLRQALVLVQVAFSMFLLAGAGLFLRSLHAAASAPLGLKAENVVIVAVDPALHGYTKEQANVFLETLKTRVVAQPGVESMGYTDVVPLSIGGVVMGLRSSKETPRDQAVYPDVFTVSEDYFKTLGIQMVAGRDFQREPANAEIASAVLNRESARRLFGDQSALGRMVYLEDRTYQVVGVVANTKTKLITESDPPAFYRLLRQNKSLGDSFFGTALLVKTAGPPMSVVPAIRNEIRALDANLPVFGIETMVQHANKSLLLPQLMGSLFGVFGASGLALAVVGLYGVMSYIVRRRTREIGIRMALGADRAQLLSDVAKQGIVVVLIGVAIGLAMSIGGGRLAAKLLYGVKPTDVVTLLCVTLLLIGVSMVAILVPARRAAKVDPMRALRWE